tara:strand:- start:6977 stop:7684 length:708 start_codon:yes stop_codon:yes gene_type:complete
MKKLKAELKKHADSEKAKILHRFFKTGKGQYGEGDIFLGIVVPKQREIVKKFGGDLSIAHVQKLINSKIHEERLIGLLILVERYKKGDEKEKKFIFNLYLSNSKKVNNWDLVDLTAPNIVGNYLLNKKQERKILYKLAKSENLWEKRIAIISTFAFIRKNDFADTLKISKILLKDKHDLIHKAVGWMLREVGKRDQDKEEKFLKKHYKNMPRTMLRYAIERFEESLRKKYLNGEI